jgi:hypothetical protein
VATIRRYRKARRIVLAEVFWSWVFWAETYPGLLHSLAASVVAFSVLLYAMMLFGPGVRASAPPVPPRPLTFEERAHLELDYALIDRLDIEVYGHTWPHVRPAPPSLEELLVDYDRAVEASLQRGGWL